MDKNNTNIFYWIKKHPKLTGILAIIIYIVIPILPFIQSPIGIFSKEDATLFLNYYGTIISGLTGGALTLGGVWWTINYEKQERQSNDKKQMEILDKQEFPFPLFELSYIPNNDTEGKKEKFDKFTTVDIKKYNYDCDFQDTFLNVQLFAYNKYSTEVFNLKLKYIYLEVLYCDKKEKLKLLNLDDGDLLVSTIPRQCKAEINLNVPINKKYKNPLSIAEKVNIYIEFEYNNKHMFPHKQEIMIDCFCMINDELTDNAKTIWHPEKFNSSIKIKNIT